MTIRLTILGEPASKFSRVTYIYALIDPADEVRYIGKSDAPLFRFRRHLKDAADTRKGRWLRLLARAGQRPTLRILQVVAFEQWQEAERAWIAKLGSGALTNSTEGGIGPLAPSAETREKMRARKLGGSLTPDHRLKVSEALKGRPKPKRSREHSERLGATTRGVALTTGHREKLAQANRRRPSATASGYRGVYFDRDRGKYQATITVDTKLVHLGRFRTAEDAAAAVTEASRSHGWLP